ncbi:hypothetical protein FA95DRAFT_1570343 [Auriscalpium vulgare]|uniref:Uncharacterized protein n=1 Tax=Auriscalpium vulgare TaxID=40419 RepID=A0ACB8S4D1_9AGAM|nr:hypothetical protein FA95DRAFT_1570343 [Auriscalpium vulgare]
MYPPDFVEWTKSAPAMAGMHSPSSTTGCSMYNAAPAHISALPDELLSRIFFDYAIEMDIFSPHWTGIMLVCRRWARVATGYAKLWSYVDLCDGLSTRAEMQLCRSQEHELALFGNYRTDGVAFDTVLRVHGHRVRSLNIEAEAATLDSAFMRFKALPILESLVLDVTRGWAYRLPDLILGAVRLRSICLYGAIHHAGWTGMSNLTELKIQPYDDIPIPTFDDIFSLLYRCPQLRTLALDNCLPTSTDGAIPASERIPTQLAVLEDLDLGGAAEVLHYLLQGLLVPSTAALRLLIRRGSGDKHLSGLLNAIWLHLRGPGAPPLRSIGIESEPGWETTFRGDTAFRTSADYVHFSMTFITDKSDRGVRQFLSKTLNAMPLESAAHLFAAPCPTQQLSKTTWRAVFERLPHVATVETAMGTCMLHVVGGLVAKRSSAWGRRGHAVQPTRLRLVVQEDAPTPARVLEELDALLSAYMAMEVPCKPAGTPLGSLDVVGINGPGDDVYAFGKRLRSRVGQLTIDGETWDSAWGLSTR